MPAKVTEHATDPRIVDRWDGGVGWIAHPGETMERVSHALVTEAGVWLVDPIDADGVDALLEEYGDVAGVIVLSNYHARDADRFAARYDVPVTLPEPMDSVADDLFVDVNRLTVGGTVGEYELLEVANNGSSWQEYALYDGETLVASESVGTADYIRVGDERLGVLLLTRLTPPRAAFGDLAPDRIVSGHGSGVHEDAAEALDDALRNARRRLPRALVANGREQLSTVLAAIRT